MIDFADLYLHHSHLPKQPVEKAVGMGGVGRGQPIHELVGGTLSAQAYTERLETLEQRVGSFEEKLMNLTRLIKLSQGLQAEKEAEMRADNEELRSRLQRQEHITAQLMRELANVKEQCELKASHDSVSALEKNLQATSEAASEVASRLSRAEEEQRDTTRALAAELDETKVWARRNLQRLKEHVDAVNGGLEEVRGGHSDLASRMAKMDCKAELEYKKLRLLLQQKATEADAMAALIEKELWNVRQVAQRHEVLASPEVTSLSPAVIDALKFRS